MLPRIEAASSNQPHTSGTRSMLQHYPVGFVEAVPLRNPHSRCPEAPSVMIMPQEGLCV